MPTSYNRRRTTGGTRTTKRNTTTTTRGASARWNSGTLMNVRNNIQNKINSFQYLYATTKAGNKNWCPTPAQITRFTNFVNKGYCVHKVTGRQIAKWAKYNGTYSSPTTAMSALKNRFGTAIKGVTYGPANGNFLVATATTVKGKPFKFPK